MSEFQVGDRVAGYELLELVGEGRRGQVYRALQPRLERVVAIKIIRPELAADEHFRKQFRRDMRMVASVDHPNVLPVYEADEADGTLYAAMRWVAGPDLHQLIRERGSLGLSQSVRIVGSVAGALEAAHGVGLVHRDLKPTNILLEGDRVYLSDFGLTATAATADGEQLGAPVGDIEYAAPELLDDAPTDSRTDVYGLGCVLYESLTGAVPFPPESLAVSPSPPAAPGPAPASERRPELPSAIDDVLARALAPAPADRYRAPAEFVSAVEDAIAPQAVDEHRRGRRRRRLLAVVAAAILAATAIGAVVALDSGGGHGGKHPQASTERRPAGGRRLPSPASLPDCGAPFSGPPRDCRSPAGVNVITDVGRPLRLTTMNFTVTGVHVARELRDSSGARFTAPAGTRLIVIDATVTNITKLPREFESENLAVWGRSTSLWLFDRRGEIVPYHGRHGADYSTQYDSAIGALQAPLSKIKLYPKIPYAGQLVFYYPEAMLAVDHRALLEVHELGHGFDYRKSLGGVRLHP